MAVEAADASCSGHLGAHLRFHSKTRIEACCLSHGIIGGASIGREGPTVQIAASGFAWVGRRIRKVVPHVDFQTYLISGAAAGVAAAFNTPPCRNYICSRRNCRWNFWAISPKSHVVGHYFRDTTKAVLGDYLYFGHPVFSKSDLMVIPEAFLIGTLGGLFGGGFAKLLAYPKLTQLPERWWPRALTCGILCSIIGLLTHGDTAGSGYEVTKRALESTNLENASLLFPLAKLSTTVCVYFIGNGRRHFFSQPFNWCRIGYSSRETCAFCEFSDAALMGMVAFFSGVVQAPLTAVIIVMEMTDEHILILPFMISAFLAHGVGKWIMPIPLYRFLANRHQEG